MILLTIFTIGKPILLSYTNEDRRIILKKYLEVLNIFNFYLKLSKTCSVFHCPGYYLSSQGCTRKVKSHISYLLNVSGRPKELIQYIRAEIYLRNQLFQVFFRWEIATNQQYNYKALSTCERLFFKTDATFSPFCHGNFHSSHQQVECVFPPQNMG